RRHSRADHVADHPVPAQRARGRAGADLAVRTGLKLDTINRTRVSAHSRASWNPEAAANSWGPAFPGASGMRVAASPAGLRRSEHPRQRFADAPGAERLFDHLPKILISDDKGILG